MASKYDSAFKKGPTWWFMIAGAPPTGLSRTVIAALKSETEFMKPALDAYDLGGCNLAGKLGITDAPSICPRQR